MGCARRIGIAVVGTTVLSLAGCFVRAPVPEPFPGVAWERTFGGDGFDGALSVQQTTDGGYIVAGWTWSFGAGSCDVYLVKTDAQGNLVWQKSFGGSGFDAGRSVQQTSDGGYIVAGGTTSFGGGDYDVYLVKTDALGNLVWQKTFGESWTEVGYSVQQTADGGYIVAGETQTGAGGGDVYLVKTDASGNLEWQRTFGGSESDYGTSVQQTTDGGYIITGETSSFGAGGCDVYLVKTDAQGNLVWQKTFGRAGGEVGESVDQTADGGYIVAGCTYSFGTGLGDVYLVKTDAQGNLVWERTFGGSDLDGAYAVQQTADGGYILAGYTHSFGGGLGDVYLVKADPQGNLVWQETFGGNGDEGGRSVRQTADGGYIVAGSTQTFGAGLYDVYLITVQGGIYWRKAGPTLVEP